MPKRRYFVYRGEHQFDVWIIWDRQKDDSVAEVYAKRKDAEIMAKALEDHYAKKA